MKVIFLFTIMFFLFFSCSSVRQSTKMKHEDIVKGITQSSPKKENEELTADALKRLKFLVPKEILLKGIEEKEKELQKKKTFQQSWSANPDDFPKEVDLTDRDTNIKQQDGPKCTAWGTVAAMENQLNKVYKSDWNLSEMHLWSKYKEYSTDDALEAAERYKIADEKYWPTGGNDKGANKHAHAKITKQTYLGKNPVEVLKALNRGNAVVVAMQTPRDMLNCRATIRTTTSFSSGGHALAVTGYDYSDNIPGKYYFWVKNSWGADCGDEGYQYVPFFDICKKGYCYFYEINEVSSDLIPENPTPTPEPEPTPEPKPLYEWVCASYNKWWPPQCWFGNYEYDDDCCDEWQWIKIK